MPLPCHGDKILHAHGVCVSSILLPLQAFILNELAMGEFEVTWRRWMWTLAAPGLGRHPIVELAHHGRC
jgi:hypothetical protein